MSAFRVPKGYGCSYFNRCLIFTKEDYWDTCCSFFLHGGEISGVVEDMVPRRSPIPSGGLEIKLKATFKAVAPLADKIKVLLRAAYDYEFQAQKRGMMKGMIQMKITKMITTYWKTKQLSLYLNIDLVVTLLMLKIIFHLV